MVENGNAIEAILVNQVILETETDIGLPLLHYLNEKVDGR